MRKKSLNKKQKKTSKEMLKIRKEDTVRLRKKSEELIKSINEDRAKLVDIYKKRQEQIRTLETQLLKNQGALDILKLLLEDNNG